MYNGILILDKPSKLSSFEAMEFVKRALRVKKAGYLGTLDPFATGVLPICLGEATKIIRYLDVDSPDQISLINLIKEYQAVLHLGVRTDTLDRSGKILSLKDVSELNLSEDQIYQVFKGFVGDIDQIPPMFSALKFNGKRLYKLARLGVEVQRAPRRVRIYNLKIDKIELPKINFWVNCSKGTYIRSLAASIGDELGCGGHLSALRRTRSGIFSLDSSITVGQLGQLLKNFEPQKQIEMTEMTEMTEEIKKFIIPISSALSVLPKLKISRFAYKKVLNGNSILLGDLMFPIQLEGLFSGRDLIRVETESGKLLCIGRALIEGEILVGAQHATSLLSRDLPVCRPERVFREAISSQPSASAKS